MSRNLFFGLISTVAMYAAQGQQDTISTKTLEDVVIVGSRYERSISESNRTIDVISSKEIESAPYLNVAELLSQQKGIFVVGQTQTPGSNQSLFLRGANSNNVNILIDGVRVNDPSTPGGAVELSELSLVNVERIEILKGSQGVLYGSMGVGGVINIITKKPEPGFSGNIAAEAGTFGKNTSFFQEEALLNYHFTSGIYFTGGMMANQVEGIDATEDTTTGFSTQDQDDFTKFDWTVKSGIKRENLEAFVSYKNIDQKSDIDDGAFSDDDNATLEFERDLINYQAKYDIGSSSVQWIGGWTSLQRISENDSSIIDPSGATDQSYSLSEFEGKSLTNEVQWVLEKETFSLVTGIGRFNEEMDFYSFFFSSQLGSFETDPDSVDFETVTNYLFSQITLFGQGVLENGILTAGGRFTDHSRFGSQFSYEISPGFVWDKGRVYIVLASGFKNPSLTQLFDPSRSVLTNRGNENLEPETSLSLELGGEWSPITGVELSLTLFTTRLQNAIEYVYLWDQNTSIADLSFTDYLGDTYLNIGEQTNQGMEFGARLNFGAVRLSADYSFLDGTFSYSPDEIDTNKTGGNTVQIFSNGSFLTDSEVNSELARRPSHLVKSFLDYQFAEPLNIGLRYRYVSARNDSFFDPMLGPFGALNTLSVDDYHLVDLIAGYNYSQFSASIRVENLFDRDFNEIQGFRSRGRGYYLRAGYRF